MSTDSTPAKHLRCSNCGMEPEEADVREDGGDMVIDCTSCGESSVAIDFTEARDIDSSEYSTRHATRTPTGPVQPAKRDPQVGDGEASTLIDPLVYLLFTGEIDKEEFDRRVEEEEMPEEHEFIPGP